MLKTACGNGFPLNIPSEIPTGGGGASSADDVSYDNTSSGLTATNVQEAIDEIAGARTAIIERQSGETAKDILTRLYAVIDSAKITERSVLVLVDISSGNFTVLPINTVGSSSGVKNYSFGNGGSNICYVYLRPDNFKFYRYALGTASPLAPTYNDRTNDSFSWQACYILY